MADVVTAWNGHYWRDPDGVWRYSGTGAPVPGGRDRRAWDGAHRYPVEDGFVCVPEGAPVAFPDLIPVLTQEGVLAETYDGVLRRYLVPEHLWRVPQTPHPEGGMWAPELDDLVDSYEFAEMVGVCWQRLRNMEQQGHGLAPVMKVKQLGGYYVKFWPRVLAQRFADEWNSRAKVRMHMRARLSA